MVRYIVVAACTTVLFFQLLECIHKLRSPSVATHTRIHFNKSMNYPALTVCPNPGYKQDILQEFNLKQVNMKLTSIWRDFRWNNDSLSDVWKLATYKLNETLALYGLGQREENLQVRKQYYYLHGQCFTFLPVGGPTMLGEDYGYFLLLTAQLLNNKSYPLRGWDIYIHEANDVWSENPLQSSSRQDKIFLALGESLKVKVSVTQFGIVSHPHEPCINDPNYSQSKCEETCRWQKLTQDLHCKGPWMPDLDLKHCTSYDTMKRLLVRYLQFGNYTKHCQCHKPCFTNQYTTYMIERVKLPHSYSQLRVYYGSGLVQQLVEGWAYDSSQFLADVGGSLGFLLGVSVLSLLHLLEQIVEWFLDHSGTRYIRRTRRQNTGTT